MCWNRCAMAAYSSTAQVSPLARTRPVKKRETQGFSTRIDRHDDNFSLFALFSVARTLSQPREWVGAPATTVMTNAKMLYCVCQWNTIQCVHLDFYLSRFDTFIRCVLRLARHCRIVMMFQRFQFEHGLGCHSLAIRQRFFGIFHSTWNFIARSIHPCQLQKRQRKKMESIISHVVNTFPSFVRWIETHHGGRFASDRFTF